MKNLEEVFFPPRILYPPIKGEDSKKKKKDISGHVRSHKMYFPSTFLRKLLVCTPTKQVSKSSKRKTWGLRARHSTQEGREGNSQGDGYATDLGGS